MEIKPEAPDVPPRNPLRIMSSGSTTSTEVSLYTIPFFIAIFLLASIKVKFVEKSWGKTAAIVVGFCGFLNF